MCEKAGASALCIHPRTRDQLYTGYPDMAVAKEVTKNVNIPVMISGDIVTGKSGLHILDYTDAAFGMVGRGALGAPWIFEELKCAEIGHEYTTPTLENKMEILRFHVNLAAKYKGWRVACLESRKHLSWYVKGLKHAASLRNAAITVSSEASLERFIALVLEIGGEVS